MLPLLLLLSEGLLWHGTCTTDSTPDEYDSVSPLDTPPLSAPQAPGHWSAAEEPLSFRLLHIASFANHSWAHTEGSGWLGELQTHVWDSVVGTIRFLKPWSRGNFSEETWRNLEAMFQLYFHGFTQGVQAFATQFQLEYPFELQILAGCTVHAGKDSVGFFRGAYKGSDLLSFQGNSWEPSPGAGTQAQDVCTMLNGYRGLKELLKQLLEVTCPCFLAGLLEAGRSELEQQVKPEAWLSSSPGPGHGHLQLVCHVSGFYPKPVWVTWVMGEQEQQGTRRGDTLPNADGTWYLRATLEVEAGQAAGLACRVKHSSLGGRDLVLYWGGRPSLVLLACGTVMAVLVMLLVLDSCHRKHRSNPSILSAPIPKTVFSIGANAQDLGYSEQCLCLAQESWIKTRILKWKSSLK